jgi:aerobic-type carbon monoxide dehydrogenase small subunit (CoxS/CutS family)
MATALTRNLSINGKTQAVSVDDNTEPLLYVLRNQLGEKGPKFGCGVAQCGACTVLVDGKITRSCVTAMSTLADGAKVTTLDGLGSAAKPHPLQHAFIEQQAGQCAYCGNAMIMGALGFLQGRIAAGNRAVPTEDEIKQFLSGTSSTSPLVYLCRCGSHLRIIRAIQQAAKEML